MKQIKSNIIRLRTLFCVNNFPHIIAYVAFESWKLYYIHRASQRPLLVTVQREGARKSHETTLRVVLLESRAEKIFPTLRKVKRLYFYSLTQNRHKGKRNVMRGVNYFFS